MKKSPGIYVWMQRTVRSLAINTGMSNTRLWQLAKRLDCGFLKLGLHGDNPDIYPLRFLPEWLKPGMTMVDLGANVGLYTLPATEIVGPEGRVYAFEPNPVPFAVLTEKVREREGGKAGQQGCIQHLWSCYFLRGQHRRT